MWRVDRDESGFSDARYIAWEYVLPHKHIPILEKDYENVDKIMCFLENTFSEQALKLARKNIGG